MSLTEKLFGGKPAPSSSSDKKDIFTKSVAAPVATDKKAAAAGGDDAKQAPVEEKKGKFDPEKLFKVAAPAQRESRKQKSARLEVERMELAKKGGPIEMKKAKKHLNHFKDDHAEEDKRTVFVGNLPNDVEKKAIEKHFKKCGEIENVRIRCQQLDELEEGAKARGRAVRILRGEVKKDDAVSAVGYILFKTREATSNATALSGSVLNGRHLTVTTEDAEGKAFMPRTSLFLGNLNYDISDEEVWQFFITKGFQPNKLRITRDRETGQAKGFGYIGFPTPDVVDEALKLRDDPNGIRGRQVRICHVQKSKTLNVVPSRREKRQNEMKKLPVAGPHGGGGNFGHQGRFDNRGQQGGQRGGRNAPVVDRRQQPKHSEKPAWMGVATNPRKKIARDLRPLAEGPKVKDRRAMKGHHPQMKKQTAPPKK